MSASALALTALRQHPDENRSHPSLDSAAGCRKPVARDVIRSILPVLAWLPRYPAGAWLPDLIAGLTIGIMLIPQGLPPRAPLIAQASRMRWSAAFRQSTGSTHRWSRP